MAGILTQSLTQIFFRIGGGQSEFFCIFVPLQKYEYGARNIYIGI